MIFKTALLDAQFLYKDILAFGFEGEKEWVTHLKNEISRGVSQNCLLKLTDCDDCSHFDDCSETATFL